MKICPTCKAGYAGRPPRCPLDGTALVDAGADQHGGRVVGGRYRLIERCGVGPSAEVYRTHDVKAGAIVAARVPNGSDNALRRRLADQVRAYNLVAPHPCLVPVVDVVDRVMGGRTLVVTEFVTTPALPHLLAANTVAVPQAVEAMLLLTGFLEHIHARGVVARDLRAGAVFLGVAEKVTVRVTLDALTPGPEAPVESMMPGERIARYAAAAYVAPERLRGEPATAASDVYALGALGFEILTGQQAFPGDTEAVVALHLEAPAPVLREALPGAPRALEALLARMFAKLPKYRPTVREVAEALREIQSAPSS